MEKNGKKRNVDKDREDTSAKRRGWEDSAESSNGPEIYENAMKLRCFCTEEVNGELWKKGITQAPVKNTKTF